MADLKRDELDHELDVALAKYAAIEPRAGLEDRVLASLRAERERAAPKVWWRWPAASLAAALIVAAGFLMRRPGNPTPEIAAHQPAATTQGDKQSGTRIASNDASSPVRHTVSAVAKRPARHGVRPPQAILASGPRLDHFPSPRPLSNEEKLLVLYVRDFPQDAVMIARAQAETEKEMDRLNGNAPSEANRDPQ
ncbi:MAG: hypothetical protein WAN60_20060 [Candidatus Sulfotelmatobacter sp.]